MDGDYVPLMLSLDEPSTIDDFDGKFKSTKVLNMQNYQVKEKFLLENILDYYSSTHIYKNIGSWSDLNLFILMNAYSLLGTQPGSTQTRSSLQKLPNRR